MPAVEFHVLPGDGPPEARLRHACRLAEEGVARGLRVYLQTATQGDALRLDELLWTFSDGSFLPHEIFTGAATAHERVHVLLGEQAAPLSHRQLLINLTETTPADLDRYERIAEIVDVDPERRRTARERFKQYRERGCTPDTKNV